MKIGFACVSIDQQSPVLQLDALKAAGCDQVSSDEGVSGASNPHKGEGFAAGMAAIVKVHRNTLLRGLQNSGRAHA